MKLKLIAISLAYLISVYLLASPSFIGIFTHGLPLAVLGVIGMLGTTGAYGAYMYTTAISSRSLPELPMNEETEYTKFMKLTDWFAAFRDLDMNNNLYKLSSDLPMDYKDGLMRNNPFRNTSLGERIQNSVSGVAVKYDQTLKILSESFDSSDITYRNYLSVLDNVLKLSSAHLRSIKKRICVFDYRTWSEDRGDEMCRRYIGEVETSVLRLEEIGDKFDNLLHELICLDEISEAPLHDMQNLIETTSDYKSIEDQ